MDGKKVNPQMFEMLKKMSDKDIEKLKNETKDEALLNEIKYTLKMVPRLKPKGKCEELDIGGTELNMGAGEEEDDSPKLELNKHLYQSTPLIGDELSEDLIEDGKPNYNNDDFDDSSNENDKSKEEKPTNNTTKVKMFRKSNSLTQVLTKRFLNIPKEDVTLKDKNDNNLSFRRKFSILDVLETRNKSMQNIMEEGEADHDEKK